MARTNEWLLAVVIMAAALGWGTPVIAAESAERSEQSNHDPIEPFNRGIFWFNDKLDVYVLEPLARGYDFITPNRVKQSLSNFFQNLRFPIVATNNLLQGKLVASASDVGRFAVNTTVGVAGFFDPASDWGLQQHDEDFGQTLGYWGVPPGPFLMLPFWGPSNIRDGVGLVADSAAAVYPWFIPIYYSLGAQGVRTINGRSLVLREVEELKQASVDYYAAVRNAYTQRRQTLVNDGEMSKDEQADLYNVEDNGGTTP